MTTSQTHIVEDNENGIYYREWQTNKLKDPKAIVLLVHGIGEHCQRYDAIASALNDEGYTVSSLDLPNHGRSVGQKGHVESFSLFQQAVLGLYQRIQQAYPKKPIFILGHSMGGLITSRFLIDHQDKFKGALLSGPAIETPLEPPAWQAVLIKGIAKLFPKLGVAPVLDGSIVSRDTNVVDAYNNDPLINKNKLTAKLLLEFSNTMDEVKQGADVITLPLLIMHGTADQLTSVSGSQWLHDHVYSMDKSLKLYESLYHEIFNEPEAPSVYQDVIEWLDKHLK